MRRKTVKACNRVIKIHTDGGCRGNQNDNNIGGIGIVARAFEDGKELKTLEYKQGYINTTNNIMELTAVIKALELCSKFMSSSSIEIYSDSAYVVNGMNEWVSGWVRRGWKKSNKKPVENKELWQKLLSLSESGDVKFIKTNGHADDELNNRADELVNLAMDDLKK